MHTHLQTQTHYANNTHTHMCKHMHIYKHMQMATHANTHTHANKHKCVNTNICKHTHRCANTQTHKITDKNTHRQRGKLTQRDTQTKHTHTLLFSPRKNTGYFNVHQCYGVEIEPFVGCHSLGDRHRARHLRHAWCYTSTHIHSHKVKTDGARSSSALEMIRKVSAKVAFSPRL